MKWHIFSWKAEPNSAGACLSRIAAAIELAGGTQIPIAILLTAATPDHNHLKSRGETVSDGRVFGRFTRRRCAGRR